MYAAQLSALNQPLQWTQWPDPEPQAEEVTVAISHAALNHRDLYIQEGLYAGIQLPCIMGSDGVGIVEKITSESHHIAGGDRVLICPSVAWGESERVQGSDFRVLGMPDQGTLATQIVRPVNEVFPCPSHLTDEEAAALPLAGLTAYRALFTQGQLTAGDRVLITGIGGGVAMMGLQLAIAAGALVWVTSGSQHKIDAAIALGAQGGVNYTTDDWDKALKKESGGVDVILDGAGGQGYNQLMNVANPGARIISYGGTAGPVPKMSPQKLFWKQLHLIGSTMGSPNDFKALLSFVDQHKITPQVDTVFPITKINEAFAYFRSGQQQGKVVISIA